jgi:hypothetical protein
MAYSTKIGDAQPTAVKATVAALPVSVVTAVEVSDAADPVNNTLVSGKKLGACYIMTERTGGLPVLVIATGSDTTSTWVRQDTKAEIRPS